MLQLLLIVNTKIIYQLRNTLASIGFPHLIQQKKVIEKACRHKSESSTSSDFVLQSRLDAQAHLGPVTA